MTGLGFIPPVAILRRLPSLRISRTLILIGRLKMAVEPGGRMLSTYPFLTGRLKMAVVSVERRTKLTASPTLTRHGGTEFRFKLMADKGRCTRTLTVTPCHSTDIRPCLALNPCRVWLVLASPPWPSTANLVVVLIIRLLLVLALNPMQAQVVVLVIRSLIRGVKRE